MIPAAGRHALLVAISRYRDPKLRQLRAPAADAERLAAVLADPAIGDFDVEVARDEEEPKLRRRIARFFGNRGLDDVLLLHFSCHGVKDDGGRLYLAASDTEVDLLDATGLSSVWLNEQVARTRAKRVVMFLDCCFSGSFAAGMRARAGDAVNLQDHLEGRGRAVITASNSMEYAYEGDELSGEGQPSVFTEALVEALASGRADRDQDRKISIDELYAYVYDRVKETNPNQSPTKIGHLEGELYVATSSYEAPVEPANLDDELLRLMESPITGARLGVVNELSRLAKSRNRSVTLAARLALERMVDDDSRMVAAAAATALESSDARTTERRDADGSQEPQARVPQASPRATRVEALDAVTSDEPFPGRATLRETDSDEVPASEQRARPAPTAAAPADTAIPATEKRARPGGKDDEAEASILPQRGLIFDDLTFSPDGQLVALEGKFRRSKRDVIRVVDIQSRAKRLDLRPPGPVSEIAFTPDSRLLAAAVGRTTCVWDLNSGKQLVTIEQTIEHPEVVPPIALSPDGALLVTGATYGGTRPTRIWSVSTGEPLLTLKRRSEVYSLAFSPNGRLLAVGSGDKTARLWEVESGKEVLALKHSGTYASPKSVAFSPDGRLLATAANGVACVWTIKNGRQIFSLKSDPIWAVAFSPDGGLLATGGAGGEGTSASPWYGRGAARTWSVDSRTELLVMKHPYWVPNVGFAGDGRLLTKCVRDKRFYNNRGPKVVEVRIWDIDSGKEILALSTGS